MGRETIVAVVDAVSDSDCTLVDVVPDLEWVSVMTISGTVSATVELEGVRARGASVKTNSCRAL